ncbi:ABC transporter permease [bacterium]|nr:ABC transporter permease [bacterium]
MKNFKKYNLELKIGVIVILLFILWCISWLVYSFIFKATKSGAYFPQMSIESELLSPGSAYLLGTDIYGRSVLEVLSAGLLYSLGIGLVVSFLSASIGVAVAKFSASKDGIYSTIFDSITNLVFVFPSILIAIIFMSFLGQSFWGLVAVMVFTGWPGYAKVAKGEIKRVMSLSFYESAEALGMSEFRRFFKIIIPSIMPVVIIQLVLGMSGVIVSESVLGFLGLGGSEYSWGALLANAKTVLLEAPYLSVVISATMAIMIIGLNLLGDGLRDYLDPKK